MSVTYKRQPDPVIVGFIISSCFGGFFGCFFGFVLHISLVAAGGIAGGGDAYVDPDNELQAMLKVIILAAGISAMAFGIIGALVGFCIKIANRIISKADNRDSNLYYYENK